MTLRLETTFFLFDSYYLFSLVKALAIHAMTLAIRAKALAIFFYECLIVIGFYRFLIDCANTVVGKNVSSAASIGITSLEVKT
jgi:hypothetical protein